jgi:hypothetical protein
MLNRRFTLRETILLVICAIVGLGIFYYEVVYKNIENSLQSYSVENLESEAMIYQAQLARKKSMEDYINSHRGENLGEIALYNNLANEISELGRILKDVDGLSISWGQPTLIDTTVRREANISFTTVGYSKIKSLIASLNRNAYRSLISDLSISADRKYLLNEDDEIKVNVRMTFFERVDETTNLEGLTIIKS